MFERYSKTCLQVIMIARLEAGRVGSDAIDTEHLLMGIVHAESVLLGHIAPAISLDSVRERASHWHTPKAGIPKSQDLPLTAQTQQVLQQTQAIADARACGFIRTEHLLHSLLTVASTHAADILQEAGTSRETLEEFMSKMNCNEQQERSVMSFEEWS
jgi:ATP-dependent Clp protease ATP-binding subunit ClpA